MTLRTGALRRSVAAVCTARAAGRLSVQLLPVQLLSIQVLSALVVPAHLLPAQSVYATSVIAFDQKGGAGGGIFNPQNALGAPDGQVCSLGVGGNLTLGFAVTIVDGPGADFIVSENPFFSGPMGHAFSEVCFVEVSSNGVDFARMPSGYYGPQTYPGPFGVVHVGWYSGLGGVAPAYFGGRVDGQDVVQAGGDAFDLADLKSDPLVLTGKVVLSSIKQVRFVDVVSGTDRDSRGILVFDPSTGSADLDSVTVIHHAGNQAGTGPVVDLQIPADGNFTLTVSCPSGIGSLDPASLGVSLYGMPLANPFDLLGVLQVASFTPNRFTLRLGTTLPPGFPLHMSVALKDFAGQRSGASRVRPI